MIGNLLAVLQPQEIAQRHRIRTPPGNAGLAGDPLEIANHVHAEVTPRGQRRRAHLRRVIRLARRLDKEIKTARDQHFLKPIVKHMPRRARHFPPGHDQIALPIALTPHRHPHKPRSVPLLHTESTKLDFVNGLLSGLRARGGDDRSRRARLASFTLAGLDIERVMDALHCAVPIPQHEIGMRSAFRRQILRQRLPLASRRERVEKKPFSTSRTLTERLRPPRLAARINDAIRAHSASLVSLGYPRPVRSAARQCSAVPHRAPSGDLISTTGLYKLLVKY